jgi:ubiquinone/menaquinone biosynthesis C-methylase UbiE
MKDNKFLKIDPNNSTIALDDKSIDIIFTSEVLEHVYNLTQVMNEFHRVLKDNGVIVMSTPNFNHFKVKINHLLFGKIDRLGGTMGDGGHRNFLTQEFFRHFVKDYFDIIEESGDIDLLPVSNLLPFMQKILQKRYYYYRENNKLNKLSYQYLRVLRKKDSH